MAKWPSGQAEVCKTFYSGSSPLFASSNNSGIAMFKCNGAVASSRNWVVNNTVILEGNGWALNQGPGCVSNRVVNNILMSNHPLRGSITIGTPRPEGFESDYNIVVDRFSADNGDKIMPLVAWKALGYDRHSTISTPARLVVDAATGQLELKPGSPAIDRGKALPANLVTNDAVNVTRPLDGDRDRVKDWDIGALEYGGKAGTALNKGLREQGWGL